MNDMKANKHGQRGAEESSISCKDVCNKYRPNKLPKDH